MTAGIEVYGETTVEAGIPEIGKVGAKYGWKVSVSGTYGQSNEEAKELSWEESGTLQPGESVHLEALTRVGSLPALEYEGTFEITMKSGEKFSFPIRDTYTGVTYSSVEVVDTETAVPLGETLEPAPMRAVAEDVDEVVQLGEPAAV